jgi:hypothetical protein
MSMENHSGMISRGKIPDSSLAIVLRFPLTPNSTTLIIPSLPVNKKHMTEILFMSASFYISSGLYTDNVDKTLTT